MKRPDYRSKSKPKGRKRLGEDYSEAISMLKEKCKDKPKPSRYLRRSEKSGAPRKNAVSQLRDASRKDLNRTSNHIRAQQQPIQGHKKGVRNHRRLIKNDSDNTEILRISDDIDLDMYASPKKGITPLTGVVAGMRSENNFNQKYSLKSGNEYKSSQIGINRVNKPLREIKSTTRVGVVKHQKVYEKRDNSVPTRYRYSLSNSQSKKGVQRKNMNIYKQNTVNKITSYK